MLKKIIIAAVVVCVVCFVGCGEKKEASSDEGSIFDETPSATSDKTESKAESLSSAAVKELQSVPGLSTDSIEAADETASQSDTTDTDAETELSTGGSVDVGGVTLSASEIPFDSEVKLDSASDAALYGDTLHLLDGKKIDSYTIADTASKSSTTTLSGSYDRIDADPYGRLYLSREKFDCALVDENGDVTPIDTTGKLSMSKVMEYGLCTSDGKITKYSDESEGDWSSVSERDLSFPENVTSVEFVGNHILIAHKLDGECTVDVCDYDGNTLATAKNGTAGDNITAMTEASGVIAASSCGDLCLWNDEGDFIGRLSSDDTANLFGADSPVIIKKLFASGDGEMLAFCESDKDSAAHLYRISV